MPKSEKISIQQYTELVRSWSNPKDLRTEVTPANLESVINAAYDNLIIHKTFPAFFKTLRLVQAAQAHIWGHFFAFPNPQHLSEFIKRMLLEPPRTYPLNPAVPTDRKELADHVTNYLFAGVNVAKQHGVEGAVCMILVPNPHNDMILPIHALHINPVSLEKAMGHQTKKLFEILASIRGAAGDHAPPFDKYYAKLLAGAAERIPLLRPH